MSSITPPYYKYLLVQAKGVFLQKLYINAYALISINLLTSITSYVFWIVAARRFDPSRVGSASAVFSVMLLIDLLTNLGLGTGLIRFIASSHDPIQGNKIIQAATTCRLIGGLAAAMFFLGGMSWWAHELLAYHTLFFDIAFISLVVFNSLYTLFNNIFIASRQTQYVILAGFTFNIIKIGVILIVPLTSGLESIILPVVLALIVVVALEMRGWLRNAYPGYSPHLNLRLRNLKGIFSYSFANQITDAFLWIPQMVLPLLVLNIYGGQTNAIFYTAHMTVGVLRTAISSVSQVVFAEGVYNPHKVSESLRKGLVFNFLVILIGGGLLSISARWLLDVFGKSYTEAIPLLRWMILTTIPFAILNLHLTVHRISGNNRALLQSSFAWTVISLLGALLGSHLAGLQGMVIGWTLGQTVSTGLFAVPPMLHKLYVPKYKQVGQRG